MPAGHRASLRAAMAIVAPLALVGGARRFVFAATGAPTAPAPLQSLVTLGASSSISAAECNPAFAAFAGASLVGVAAGVVGSLGRGRSHRTGTRVAPNAPSLLQVAEQKGLLSLLEKQKLLSAAESAGLGIDTIEGTGLLKLAEEKGLLSTVETFVTAPSTAPLLLVASAALAGATYFAVTAADVGFLQWVIAGATGSLAAVALVAALVIFALTFGTSRTRSLDTTQTFDVFTTGPRTGGFKPTTQKRSVTLVNVLEEKGLLSLVEENRLLSLAAGVVNKPLTLTEKLGILSSLEKSRILSYVESTTTETFGPFNYLAQGGIFLTVALAVGVFVNPTAGIVLAFPGLAYIVISVVLGLLQAPRKD